MRKIIVIIAVIGVLAMTALAATYKTDLFDSIKLSNFRLDMSLQRAEVLFSDYELESRTDTELKGNFLTILTYSTGEFKETLKLYFTNGFLHSFNYVNFDLNLKQLEIDLDFLSD
ncbi:hypothetical protein ES702_06798 [subsurface metagenome]